MSHDPGYIKGYLPGIRENGGQYTHGVLWFVRAMAESGRGSRAVELLDMINPIHHARTPEEVAVYQAEPYVVAADVYSQPPHVGRGRLDVVHRQRGVDVARGGRVDPGPVAFATAASWCSTPAFPPPGRGAGCVTALPTAAASYEIIIENPDRPRNRRPAGHAGRRAGHSGRRRRGNPARRRRPQPQGVAAAVERGSQTSPDPSKKTLCPIRAAATMTGLRQRFEGTCSRGAASSVMSARQPIRPLVAASRRCALCAARARAGDMSLVPLFDGERVRFAQPVGRAVSRRQRRQLYRSSRPSSACGTAPIRPTSARIPNDGSRFFQTFSSAVNGTPGYRQDRDLTQYQTLEGYVRNDTAPR